MAGASYICTSCPTPYYLSSFSCNLQCPNSMFGYLGTCYITCPQTTFGDSTFSCIGCSANCLECVSATNCSLCASNSYMLLAACYLVCPAPYYGTSTGQLCLQCNP
jgi:proprotein convertase subtilisin/kexin type 5